MKKIFDKKRGKFVTLDESLKPFTEEKTKIPVTESLLNVVETLVEELGRDGNDGLPGRDGRDGVDGAPGRDGLDGKDGTLGKDGIDGKPGLSGKDGKDGRGIGSVVQLSPNTVQIKFTDNTLQEVSLPPGRDGRDVELRSTDTYLQWSYKGEDVWENLIELPKKNLMGLRGGGANYLKDIQDIKLTNLQNGQTLTYQASTKRWINSTGGGGSWGTITGTLSSQTDLQAALDNKISKDGTTSTTDLIPFAQGIGVYADSEWDGFDLTQVYKYGGVQVGSFSIGAFEGLLRGSSDANSTNGYNWTFIGGSALAFEAPGGYISLQGGNYVGGSDNRQPGIVRTGTSITGFAAINSITGGAIIQSTQDFAVDGNFYVVNAAIFAGGIGFNGRSCPTNYTSLGAGTTAQTFGLDRNSSGAGVNYTMQAGWAQSGATNANGGNARLAGGVVAGSGTSGAEIMAAGGGGSGTADLAPVTVANFQKTTCTFIAGYILTADTTTGLKLGSSTSTKLGAYGVTPVAQQGATIDLGVALSNFGIRAAGTAYPITTSGAVAFSGTFGSSGVSSFTNATDSTSNTTGSVKLSGGLGIVKSLFVGGDIACDVAGRGLQIKTGSNARAGNATLSGGSVTISNTSITANTILIPSPARGTLTNLGTLKETARSAGTSITIGSSNVLDSSTFDYVLIEPI